MFNWFKKKKNNKGFTLVELVIVIAILAILVGLLAPQYTKYVEKSRKAADASNMDEMVKVVKVLAADPASELPVATYTITMEDAKTSVVSTGETGTGKPGETAIKAALTASIPKWETTGTKSKKWKDGAKGSIKAVITVNDEGGTSVEYSVVDYTPGEGKKDPFANYMETGTDGIQ